MRYALIDAKRADSLALPHRDTGQPRTRLIVGLLVLALLWFAL